MMSLVFTLITTAFFAPSAWCQSQMTTIGLKPPIADEQNPHALVFRERDKDSDGILSVSEYITGAGRDRKTLHREFKVFDADADGRMSLNEFLTVPVGQPENQRGVIDDPVIQLAARRQGELMKLWEKWDIDRDSLLNKPEFESAKIGLLVPGLQSAGFTKWDQDVDGMISRDDVTRTLEVAYGVRTAGGALLRNNAGLVIDYITFSRLKIGDDGMVSKADYFAALGPVEDKESWLNSIDTNRDGRFDFAEYSTGSHRTDPVSMFLNCDKDLDGLLSLQELDPLPDHWREMARFSFKGFDENQDGAISLREYQFMPHCNLLAPWTEAVDPDHDGKLQELRFSSDIFLSALAAEYFNRLDGDGDKAVSLDEFRFVTNFRPKKLIEGWGISEDPTAATKIEVKDGVLSITTPAILVDNYPPGIVNAPRVTREASGDFTAEVKVEHLDEALPNSVFKTIGNFPAYHAATLLIRLDDQNCIRFERVSMHRGTTLSTLCVLQIWENGDTTQYKSESVKDTATILRLERKGAILRSSFSQDDGKTWTQMPNSELKTLAGKVHVGLSMTNNTDPGSVVKFKDFKLVPVNASP